MPVSVKKEKKKKKKRISKLWILGRKESFCFFVDLKKKRLEANAIPSHTTPGRGKNSSGQERRKERRKEKWWKWAEISREERQRLEGGCVTDSFRTILFYIFVNCSYFIFLYFLSVICLFYFFIFIYLLIFFCLICVDFFFCYPLFLFFLFVCFFFCFFCYTLPCFLLVLGDWAYRVICFVVYCYLFIFFKFIFIYLFIYFFTFMDFLGLFFVSLTALGTSSLRLIVFPLGGGVRCTGAPFRGLVSRGSKLYK